MSLPFFWNSCIIQIVNIFVNTILRCARLSRFYFSKVRKGTDKVTKRRTLFLFRITRLTRGPHHLYKTSAASSPKLRTISPSRSGQKFKKFKFPKIRIKFWIYKERSGQRGFLVIRAKPTSRERGEKPTIEEIPKRERKKEAIWKRQKIERKNFKNLEKKIEKIWSYQKRKKVSLFQFYLRTGWLTAT